jgi:hypothetical protein
VALIVAAGAVALRATGLWSTGSGMAADPVSSASLVGVLAAGAFMLAVSWFCTPDLRPVASAAAALLVCAAVPGPHRTTSLLLALPVLAVVAAAVFDELPSRAGPARSAARPLSTGRSGSPTAPRLAP